MLDFSRRSLRPNLGAKSGFDREHVTPFIRNGNFTKLNLENVRDTSNALDAG